MPKKLACLDGLRGIAVLAVILFHLGTIPLIKSSSVAWGLAPFRLGFSGVHLFLVLSGFCLTHSLIRRARAGRSPGLRGYLADRCWRIAPPYYAAMILYLAVPAAALALGRSSSSTSTFTFRQVGVHLLFLHGFWKDTIDAINTPFWSLSLEFQFYLVLPALFALAMRFGWVPILAGVAASSVAWRVAASAYLPDQPQLLRSGFFLGRWTEFALGMAVAFWFNRVGRAIPGSGPGAALTAAALGVLGLGAFLTARNDPGHAADFAFGVGYALLLAAVLASAQCGGRLNRLVAVDPLCRVGMVSYSLYLTHNFFMIYAMLAFDRLAHRTGTIAIAAEAGAAFVAALVGGWLFYQLVERRFLRSVDAPRQPAPIVAPTSRPTAPEAPSFAA